MANGSFGFTRDFSGDITLSRAEKLRSSADLRRRDFLIRFCQGAGAALVPSKLWGFTFPNTSRLEVPSAAGYQLQPHYRSVRPLDSTLLKVQAGSDDFVSEKYADQIAVLLESWKTSLLRSPRAMQVFADRLAPSFSGASLQVAESQVLRKNPPIEVRRNKFSAETKLNRDAFVESLHSYLGSMPEIRIAEFQITHIELNPEGVAEASSPALRTRIRYELAGAGMDSNREQRDGEWNIAWATGNSGDFQILSWLGLEETQARCRTVIYRDIAPLVLGSNLPWAAQLMHGTDYWRTILDGACGIDIYGHNGASVADIDNDGFDDLYICQPAGLPNRLFRNRGDGTFEDITGSSGLGILENTACALFADFSRTGRQDVIVVQASGPVLFVNEGGGRFRKKPDAFQFANPPQGTFTGAAVADYDRDGWLDIYFCLYAFYQGTGQYKYPSPYQDAENGPPNFLMRNNRDGTFRDATEQSGLNQNNHRYSFCCGWSDFNHDGWPDLYVVNDFGRKNLYSSNGDGTFTDVASPLGAEDIGAGMSVCWLDYDNDGAQDLYVANMWTAAGERISTQPAFKKDSNIPVRSQYQKHAMGNSLLRNRGAVFENVTDVSRTGMGRWSWSSDAFDFDHDGFPDLYIANGMISGPSRADLNSFFWRQVVAVSPDEAGASKEYEQGWSAINELIRSDGTWSGYERNVFYANNGDGTFSDISWVAGLDFIEDGRSFAVADIDHDGRLEVILKNRNAPQVRVLKNFIAELPPSIAFRLEGTKSNRDAIGAAVTVENGIRRQVRMLQAGSGFLSQHSKELVFGLGHAEHPVTASICWPSGFVQELRDLPLNHRIWVREGTAPTRIEPFQKAKMDEASGTLGAPEIESLPATFESWLLAPVEAPDFSLPDFSGTLRTLSSHRGKPVLLTFWTTQSEGWEEDLRALNKSHDARATAGWVLLTVNVDEAGFTRAEIGSVSAFINRHRLSFPVLRGSQDQIAVYNILFRQLFDRHRDLNLPTSFLIDGKGNIVKVYGGPISTYHVDQDSRSIPATDAERLARGLPFPNAAENLEFGRNYLSLGTLFFQRGYLDQAESSFQQAVREDPASAEALYGVGSVYLNQNKNAAARDAFERTVKLHANYPDTLPDAWNNLGVIATREGKIEDSIQNFQQVLRLNPHHVAALENLGNAYRLQKRWDKARQVLERAVAIAPQDPEANYSLGMVLAQSNDTDRAQEYLQRALGARPDYPEALNNLGILYLLTHRRAEAVASFENCIRVAPAFDQAYLNLARVYALEGSRDKARSVLLDLLKEHPDHPEAKQLLQKLD